MNEIALVIFHGVHNHVEFVSDVADIRLYKVFIFCHFNPFMAGTRPYRRQERAPSTCIDVFLRRDMPENFGYMAFISSHTNTPPRNHPRGLNV